MALITGSILKEERKKRSMSQKDLAQRLDVSPAYINLIENGHRPLSASLRSQICSALGIEESLLIGERTRLELERLKSSQHFAHHGHVILERLVVETPEIAQSILRLEESFLQAEIALERVSNRLDSDGRLKDNIHEILSIATSLRSTSSILNTQGDLSTEHATRFRESLDEDSQVLSERLRGLVNYLGQETKLDAKALKNELVLVQYCEDNQYYFEALEKGQVSRAGLDDWLQKTLGKDLAGLGKVKRLFELFLRDIEKLPGESFLKSAEEVHWNVNELAIIFDCSADRVLRRIAMLSQFGSFENTALYIQDHTGDFLLENLSLNGYRSIELDCPFWPIFDCERERGRVFSSRLSFGYGETYQALAASALSTLIHRNRLPWVYRTMVVFQNSKVDLVEANTVQTREVGFNCRDCRIEDCGARRNQLMTYKDNSNKLIRGVTN